MFFPERIRSISTKDRVLEIGPGAYPHHRSDVFLDLKFENENMQLAQSGNEKPAFIANPIFYYDGNKFPFDDQEFDYIICSHVLEHVVDVDKFVSELKRVGKRGYLEFPMIYYDYLYNYDVHLTFLKQSNGTINWIPKNETNLEEFHAVQFFFRSSFEQQYMSLVNELKTYFFQGFEWDQNVTSQRVKSVSEVCYQADELMIPVNTDNKQPEVDNSSRLLKLFRALQRIPRTD